MDTLTAYKASIALLSEPLTRKQEQELGRRAQRGDEDALRSLIEHNTRLAWDRAARLEDSRVPLEDRIQAAGVALIAAARTFDPGRDCRFSTHVVQAIDWAIKREKAAAHAFVLPHDKVALLGKIMRCQESLRRKLGTLPTLEEIAERLAVLGITVGRSKRPVEPEDVRVLLGASHGMASLDKPIGKDEDGNRRTRGDVIVGEDERSRLERDDYWPGKLTPRWPCLADRIFKLNAAKWAELVACDGHHFPLWRRTHSLGRPHSWQRKCPFSVLKGQETGEE